MIKVAHIIPKSERAGIAHVRVFRVLARRLPAYGYAAEAWFLDKGGVLGDELRKEGLTVRYLGWETRLDLSACWRLVRALRSTNPAIVHLHGGGRLIRMVARCASDARLVAHIHGSDMELSGLPGRPVNVGGAHAVIATSEAVRRLVGHPQTTVVYPAVELQHTVLPREWSTVRPVIGTACRLVPLKGVHHLVRARARLQREFPQLEVEIAGEGPAEPFIRSEVTRLGLDDKVKFLGWQTELAPTLATWHVYVQPSLDEAFGIAALEAMAAGLPVVASAVGGLVELVEPETTGLLVKPGDEAAIAHGVRQLISNPGKASAMGRAGRQRAATCFSPDRMVRAVLQVYDYLLKGASARIQ